MERGEKRGENRDHDKDLPPYNNKNKLFSLFLFWRKNRTWERAQDSDNLTYVLCNPFSGPSCSKKDWDQIGEGGEGGALAWAPTQRKGGGGENHLYWGSEKNNFPMAHNLDTKLKIKKILN